MPDEAHGVLPLEISLHKRLERRRANGTLRQLTVRPSESIDFSSNDFLSLSQSQALRTALAQELKRSGAAVGSTGSRLLDGNSIYAENLEKQIASFHRASTGLLFNSGFDANAGLFASLPQPGDIIVFDELIHASVHDGMRLSRSSVRLPFSHNSLQDLQRVLEGCMESNPRIQDGLCHIFVAVEAVYSMDGDVTPLRGVVDIVDKTLPRGMGYVIVDEAHSTGVLGPQGRGLVCELGLEDRVFARLHTFGKALACNGAIVLCSPLLRQYLINYARPMIYTTFMSYPSLAAIYACYGLLQRGETTPLSTHLMYLVQVLYRQLQEIETSHSTALASNPVLQVPKQCPRTPIFSILTTDPKNLAFYLQNNGFVVRAIVPPTVPKATSRVRICLHAGNTVAEIESLARRIDCWLCTQLQGHWGPLNRKNMTQKAQL